ncbi:hypothetical protein ACWGQ4_20445, partial [Streptomyces sp. NPDC055721]
ARVLPAPRVRPHRPRPRLGPALGRTLLDLLDDLALAHGLHATDQLSVRVEDLSVIADAMAAPFMRAYTELLVRTCHRRGAHAIGGMAAQVPSKDPETNTAALAKVRLDKEREAEDGFDGSWVAHPGLVPTCREVFDAVLGDRPDQIHRTREDVETTAADLLSVRRICGPPTEEGVRTNIALTLRYFDAWLRGQGAVALYGLMEDAATAEIARVQIWQWLRHRVVDRATVLRLLDRELDALGAEFVWADLEAVRRLFEETALATELPSFFTPSAYERHLVRTSEDRA